jgi:hypothetical protein
MCGAKTMVPAVKILQNTSVLRQVERKVGTEVLRPLLCTILYFVLYSTSVYIPAESILPYEFGVEEARPPLTPSQDRKSTPL